MAAEGRLRRAPAIPAAPPSATPAGRAHRPSPRRPPHCEASRTRSFEARAWGIQSRKSEARRHSTAIAIQTAKLAKISSKCTTLLSEIRAVVDRMPGGFVALAAVFPHRFILRLRSIAGRLERRNLRQVRCASFQPLRQSLFRTSSAACLRHTMRRKQRRRLISTCSSIARRASPLHGYVPSSP